MKWNSYLVSAPGQDECGHEIIALLFAHYEIPLLLFGLILDIAGAALVLGLQKQLGLPELSQFLGGSTPSFIHCVHFAAVQCIFSDAAEFHFDHCVERKKRD